MRREVADVEGDHRRHRVVAGEPVPDFRRPHAQFLGEARLTVGDAPELAFQLCCGQSALQVCA